MIVAIAVGLLAPFTLWAWPFALATGIVIGTSDVDKAHGRTVSRSTQLVRVLAVTGEDCGVGEVRDRPAGDGGVVRRMVAVEQLAQVLIRLVRAAGGQGDDGEGQDTGSGRSETER